MTEREYERRVELLRSAGHQMFRVSFKRRNDKVVKGKVVAKAGEVRDMVCRFGVVKHVKGVLVPGERQGEDHRLRCVTVYEMAGERSNYKRIPVDGIIDVQPVPSLE